MTHCTVKKNKPKKDIAGSTYKVVFDNLTTGEVLALSNALRMGRIVSPVANDLSNYLRTGFVNMVGDNVNAQDLLDNINEDMAISIIEKAQKKSPFNVQK